MPRDEFTEASNLACDLIGNTNYLHVFQSGRPDQIVSINEDNSVSCAGKKSEPYSDKWDALRHIHEMFPEPVENILFVVHGPDFILPIVPDMLIDTDLDYVKEVYSASDIVFFVNKFDEVLAHTAPPCSYYATRINAEEAINKFFALMEAKKNGSH